jgi:hypothetical protein
MFTCRIVPSGLSANATNASAARLRSRPRALNVSYCQWQNTLPLMVTILATVFGASLAGWASNKNLGQRVDDLRDNMNHRLDEVGRRLDRIDQKLESYDTRLTTFE